MPQVSPCSPAASPSPPALSKFVVHTRDAHEQALEWDSMNQSYEQLSSGRFSGSLASITVGDVTVFRESLNQSVYQTGHSDAGRITIAVACELSEQAYWNGRHIGEDAVVAFAPGREFELRTPLRATCVGISFPPGLLQSLAPDLDADDWAKRYASIDGWSDGGTGRSVLAARLEAPFAGPSQPEDACLQSAIGDLVELTIDYIGSLMDRQPGSRPKLRADSYPRIARRARAVMLERMPAPMSIPDLCNELGCSRRALQYAFESIFDLNPVAYLRTLRLQAARTLLTSRRAGLTVQQVATEVGFNHLPRFAREYALMYGERPSDSLADRNSSIQRANAARASSAERNFSRGLPAASPRVRSI